MLNIDKFDDPAPLTLEKHQNEKTSTYACLEFGA